MACSLISQPSLFPDDLQLRYAFKLHRSKILHFDFYLEIGSVLLSWMLLKPPSLDPREGRLAIARPLHNPRYLFEEFVVPKGVVGAGPKMVWEKGLWQPMARGMKIADVEVEEQLVRGAIDFEISGKRLQGSFRLQRSHSDKWFLRKLEDEHCQTPCIWTDFRSIQTGRLVDEIT